MKTILGIIAITALGVVAISELIRGARIIIAHMRNDWSTIDRLTINSED